MSEYNGTWHGYIDGFQSGNSFNFTTRNHYPGDCNFSGSFSKWIRANKESARKAMIAINEKFDVVVTIEDDMITNVQKVVEI